jgi:hypothetical protein
VGQGAGVYDSVANKSTFTLSGAITSGTAGYDSGTYAFVTTYSGAATPLAGPNAPIAQSNPSDTSYFYYDYLYPSTTMTLYLTGTPDGNFAIPLVQGGNFLAGTGFSFLYTSTSCTGVAICGQNNVGLTPGASIFGPVDIYASFPTSAVPEPSTWAMLLLGFVGLGLAGNRRTKKNPLGAPAV